MSELRSSSFHSLYPGGKKVSVSCSRSLPFWPDMASGAENVIGRKVTSHLMLLVRSCGQQVPYSCRIVHGLEQVLSLFDSVTWSFDVCRLIGALIV